MSPAVHTLPKVNDRLPGLCILQKYVNAESLVVRIKERIVLVVVNLHPCSNQEEVVQQNWKN